MQMAESVILHSLFWNSFGNIIVIMWYCSCTLYSAKAKLSVTSITETFLNHQHNQYKGNNVVYVLCVYIYISYNNIIKILMPSSFPKHICFNFIFPSSNFASTYITFMKLSKTALSKRLQWQTRVTESTCGFDKFVAPGVLGSNREFWDRRGNIWAGGAAKHFPWVSVKELRRKYFPISFWGVPFP